MPAPNFVEPPQEPLEDLFLWSEPAQVIELLRRTRAMKNRRELAEEFHQRFKARPMSKGLAPLIEARIHTLRPTRDSDPTLTAYSQLELTAQSYLATLPREPACRFDAVLIDGTPPPRIEWQRDVFSID